MLFCLYNNHCSLLNFAVYNNLKIFSRILLFMGTNANIRDNQGITPIMIAVVDDNIELADSLIRHGANVDLQENKKKWSSLHFAVWNGDYIMVKHIIIQSHNINIKNKNGMTPLMLATLKGGDQNTLSLLILYGANINDRDNEGRTALDWAVFKKNVICINYLKSKGAI